MKRYTFALTVTFVALASCWMVAQTFAASAGYPFTNGMVATTLKKSLQQNLQFTHHTGYGYTIKSVKCITEVLGDAYYCSVNYYGRTRPSYYNIQVAANNNMRWTLDSNATYGN
jgi:hypothetical protein